MMPASDLLKDSRLKTTIDNGITRHIIESAGPSARQRRIRKEQHWERTARVGEGAYGTVWLEKLVAGDFRVSERAVKVIKKHARNSLVIDYNRELEAIIKFSHPKYNYCFVEFLGWFEDSQNVFIAMEYFPHGDLQDHLSEPLPESDVQQITSQILEGLSHMHENGFAHRDLKPSNILVKSRGPNWWVKIGDFGISKRAGEGLTALRTLHGTLGFIAPEILVQTGLLDDHGLSGLQEYTSAVDIWSLGEIVFRALTNCAPFSTNLASYIKGNSLFPHDILQAQGTSDEGCDLVKSLLQPIPADRPTAKETLKHPWASPQTLRELIKPQRLQLSLASAEEKRAFDEVQFKASLTAASAAWSLLPSQIELLNKGVHIDVRRMLRLPCNIHNGPRIADLENFFGREDILAQIDKHLLVPDKTNITEELRIVAICGMGGMGKTEIAPKFALNRKDYFDASFWVNADTVESIRLSFFDIALKLNLLEPGEDKDGLTSRDLVLGWLNNPVKSYQASSTGPKARWLLVYDNLDDINHIRSFWPTAGTGSVLLTSRDPLITHSVQDSNANRNILTTKINLEPFSEGEAEQFLYKMTRREYEGDMAAVELGRRLQGLPLALKQIAGIMTRRSLDFKDVLEIYDNDSHHRNILNGYQHTIATVWGLMELDSGSRMLLNVISFFSPDNIQEDILREGAAQVKAVDYPKSAYDYSNARAGLWRTSLVEIERDVSDLSGDDTNEAIGMGSQRESDTGVTKGFMPVISIHRIVQNAARAQMSPDQLQDAFEAAITLLLSRWKTNDWEDWSRYDHLYPHVIQIHAHYQNIYTLDKVMLASLQLMRLLSCAGWYDLERGRFREANNLFSAALDIHCVCSEQDEDLLSNIHSGLGSVAVETNDPRACREQYQVLLRLTQKRYPVPTKEHELEATNSAHNAMGVAEMMSARIDDACMLFDKARRAAQGQIRISELTASIYLLSSANLGQAQWIDAQYDASLVTLGEAWDFYNTPIPSQKELRSVAARIAHAIGNVKESLGNQDSAMEWYERAYTLYQEALGVHHHRTADVCHKIAAQYLGRRYFSRAHVFIDQALQVFKSQDYHKPELARTLHLRSTLLRAEGKKQEAATDLASAKKLYTEHVKFVGKEKWVNKDPTAVNFDRMVTFWSR